VVEECVEDNRRASRENGNTGVHPQDLRVDEHRNESLVERGAEGVGEEVDTLHERFHRRRGLGVGVLETGDGDEDFCQADEDVCGRLHGDVYIVGQGGVPIHSGRACAWCVVAGSGGVDEVLHDGGIGHTYGGKAEADCDTHDGAQLDTSAAKNGVDDAVEEGGKDQDGDRVEVLHEIVRHAVALHLSGLRNEVGRELSVAHPEDGVENEDFASFQCTLELIDEVIVPWHWLGVAVRRTPSWFRCIRVASLDHHADGLERIGNDLALGWTDDIRLASEDQDENADV